MKNKQNFIFFITLIISVFLTAGLSWAEVNEKSKFIYSQTKLNQIKEKNVKYRIAIGELGNSVNVSGSPFNEPNKKTDTRSETYNINIATPHIPKIGEIDINNVAGILSDLLKKTNKFDIVERQEVNQLIREIQFEGSDWAKREPANKLGNIYGVQYILLGELLPNYGYEQIGVGQYTATLRLVDVATGVVISTGTGQRDLLQEALAEAVNILSDDMEGDRWTCHVVRIDEKGIYINAGFNDKIKKNDIFAVIRLEDSIVDQTSGQVLGKKQTEIAKIQIIDILENNLALAKPLNEKASIKEGDIVTAKRIILKKDSETNLWNKIFKHTTN